MTNQSQKRINPKELREGIFVGQLASASLFPSILPLQNFHSSPTLSVFLMVK